MKKIIASLLAVLLVSSTISPAVAANIADVKSSIAFSKIENYVKLNFYYLEQGYLIVN